MNGEMMTLLEAMRLLGLRRSDLDPGVLQRTLQARLETADFEEIPRLLTAYRTITRVLDQVPSLQVQSGSLGPAQLAEEPMLVLDEAAITHVEPTLPPQAPHGAPWSAKGPFVMLGSIAMIAVGSAVWAFWPGTASTSTASQSSPAVTSRTAAQAAKPVVKAKPVVAVATPTAKPAPKAAQSSLEPKAVTASRPAPQAATAKAVPSQNKSTPGKPASSKAISGEQAMSKPTSTQLTSSKPAPSQKAPSQQAPSQKVPSKPVSSSVASGNPASSGLAQGKQPPVTGVTAQAAAPARTAQASAQPTANAKVMPKGATATLAPVARAEVTRTPTAKPPGVAPRKTTPSATAARRQGTSAKPKAPAQPSNQIVTAAPAQTGKTAATAKVTQASAATGQGRRATLPVAAPRPRPAAPVAATQPAPPPAVAVVAPDPAPAVIDATDESPQATVTLSAENTAQRYFNERLFSLWQRSGATLRYESWMNIPVDIQLLEAARFREAVYLLEPPTSEPKDLERPN